MQLVALKLEHGLIWFFTAARRQGNWCGHQGRLHQGGEPAFTASAWHIRKNGNIRVCCRKELGSVGLSPSRQAQLADGAGPDPDSKCASAGRVAVLSTQADFNFSQASLVQVSFAG